MIALNQTLIDELKKKGSIQSASTEAAFRAVLRHQFLPEVPMEEVYSDRAISTKQDPNGQWLSSSSQPAIMAIMLEQLGLQPGHRVLEVGTGTGYNAALMAHIVGESGQVVTIELDEELSQAARDRLTAAGFGQVQVVCADGGYGYPECAPYDRIILTVGAPDIAPAWWSQLKPDGRLVLPLIIKGSMKSIAFEHSDNHLASVSVQDCNFMHLRGDFASLSSEQVQLGPDPDLYLEPVDIFPIDREVIYEILIQGNQDWETSVDAALWDVLFGDLFTWLSLHEPRLCKLVAKGDMAKRNFVPALFRIDGKQELMGSLILLGETGLAALMRPPGQKVSPVTIDKLFTCDASFPLFVRQFGSDESTARRLITQIQAWAAAGRPSSDRMKIRAYPKDDDYKSSEGEMVIETRWTKLIIEWPASELGPIE